MVVPLKHTYISVLCFIGLCRFAFYGNFFRLMEVELKGFADYTLGTWYFTRPQFWSTSSERLFFFYKSAVENGFMTFCHVLGCQVQSVRMSRTESLLERPQFSHEQHPLSQKHCASFLCVHNLEMEDKVFILKDCPSSWCWWFLVCPLSKLVFFPK